MSKTDNTNKHPFTWTNHELMNYCVEHHLCREDLVGTVTRDKLIEMVLADEIDKE